MKTVLHYYDIYPKVVKEGGMSSITIESLSRHADFIDGRDYRVFVLPMCARKKQQIKDYDFIDVRPLKGKIVFDYRFTGEQPYSIMVYSDEKLITELIMYSLYEDLHKLTPYMGDLHVHTTFSDGKESPEFVAAEYRKQGLDFLAITDHGQYSPSLVAIDTYKNACIDLKLFPGEEVHPFDNHIHTVNFGGDFSVNELCWSDPEKYYEEVHALMEISDTPDDIDAFEYASCCWVYSKINEGGGLSIFPHPHWVDSHMYHVPDKTTQHLFNNKPFDAFELIGGQTQSENLAQILFYNEARANGLEIPIVGSSDSHGVINAMWFKTGRTIVFAENNIKESIITAIKDCKSIALEQYRNEENSRVHGTYRLGKFADFLVNEYFPIHDDLCYEEGRLMRDYANNVKGADEALINISGRTKRLIDKYWGRE